MSYSTYLFDDAKDTITPIESVACSTGFPRYFWATESGQDETTSSGSRIFGLSEADREEGRCSK